jgi:hypothetical protein
MNEQPTPLPSEAEEDQNIFLAVALGMGTAVVFGLGGFFLLQDGTGAMGGVLFLLLPFATGFATALIARGKQLITISLIIGGIICTSILLLTGFEGFVCVLMSFPLIALGLAVGALLGALYRRKMLDKTRNPHLLTLLTLGTLSLFLMGSNYLETPSRRMPRAQTITNSLAVHASADRTWEQLKTIDRISGAKGLLMHIGLPVPVSCEMKGEGVGATRTCYFEQGHIQELVTEWNPPSSGCKAECEASMRFKVVNFDVPGRPWLSFEDAGYSIKTKDNRTLITRTTTITSRLSPAWYWQGLEKIGVETEHEYLFEELSRRLNGAR